MATPKTGRPEGRPCKPFMADPDRYLIALAQSFIAEGAPANVAYRTVSAFAVSDMAIIDADPGHVAFQKRVFPGAPASPFSRDSTLRKKANSPERTAADLAWIDIMATLFRVARNAREESAARCFISTSASAIGETEFAKNVLLPMLEAKFLPSRVFAARRE